MTKQFLQKNSALKIFSNTLIYLPAPKNLSLIWNFGSLLIACLITQIITGLLLARAYSPRIEIRFKLISQIIETLDKGWLIRYIHANGASLFFICLYTHIGRGIYYGSYILKHTWIVGVSIFLMTIAAAFLGYVLPVNQISFWGASVITNLFREVPYLGSQLISLIWGSTSVSDPTLIRFFTFHYILPFIILVLVILHIIFLHTTGSNNPLGLSSKTNKIIFHSFFSIKDMMGLAFIFILFRIICFYYPLVLGDDENFTPANPRVTPNHIQPEWYFLFAYAILRSIPNKLGGVIALALSVIILYTLPFNKINYKTISFNPLSKLIFYRFCVIVLLLTWIGIRPVEDPYVLSGQILTVLYFSYFLPSTN